MSDNWQNLDTRAAFKKLLALKGVTVNGAALTAERVRTCSVPIAAGIAYNYAAKEQDERVLSVLQEMADEADLIGKFAELANGAIVNTGEKRKVLHHAARGKLGSETGEFYAKQQAAIVAFSAKVHGGALTNEKGDAFTDVVQIGIGGSDLGPRAMYLALEQWAKKQKTLKLRAHFISNVDPDDGAGVLADIDLSRSLFILVSKSGTTQETLANELFVKARLQKAGLDPAKHVLAVTSETSPLANNPAYLASFYMDDNIGGRYSSTSAVGGAVLSLAFGPEVFAAFLKGAHAADEAAFSERNIRKNAALLDALLGIYERNVQGHPATAILPYSQALSRFPAHLQQLDMESNGKQVNRRGEKLAYETGPVIFGEPGTNGQHSFYQLLHQGTNIVPLQFVGFHDSQTGDDVTVDGSTSQQKLAANLAAQITAFACGKENATDPNKHFPGGRPSSLIHGPCLTPETLGTLLAHFENKVMFQGFLWNLNSFDQEGVQLGKILAKQVLAAKVDPGKVDGALREYAVILGALP